MIMKLSRLNIKSFIYKKYQSGDICVFVSVYILI